MAEILVLLAFLIFGFAEYNLMILMNPPYEGISKEDLEE